MSNCKHRCLLRNLFCVEGAKLNRRQKERAADWRRIPYIHGVCTNRFPLVDSLQNLCTRPNKVANNLISDRNRINIKVNSINTMSLYQTLLRFASFSVVLFVFMASCTKAPKDATPEAISRFQNIIPKPSIEAKSDGKVFIITRATTITIANDTLQPVAQYMANVLNKGTGYNIAVKISNEAPTSGIFITTKLLQPTQHTEGYSITTAGDLMTITGSPAGVFYATQTLRQLLPPAIEIASAPGIDTTSWEIASGQIIDELQLAWRGTMLDVARHFFGMDDVKRYIDLISLYKMNILHLHLSDDQGWRIEIKSWPKLTEHGGSTQVGGGKSGFFTQEQYKQLVGLCGRALHHHRSRD